MASELKPCPFCGGKPHGAEPEVNINYVGCTECLACAPNEAAWNTRPAPAATDTGLERYDLSMFGNGIVEMGGGAYVRFEQAAELLAAERAALPILKGTAFKSGDGWKDTTKEGDICFVWNRMHPAPYAPGQYPRVGKEHWSASIENYTFEPATLGEVSKLFADLKADNAALTARVKETEDCYLRLCEAIGVAATNAAPIDASEKLQALEAKLAAAEKALAFYADPSKWNDGYFKSEDDGTVLRAYPSSIENDQGDKARAARGGKPS